MSDPPGAPPDGDMWRRFIDYAARARAKPSFDSEHRDWKPEVANQLRAAIEAAAVDARAISPLTDLVVWGLPEQNGPLGLVNRNQGTWLERWAASDANGMQGALRALLADSSGAVGRFAAFAAEAEQAGARGDAGRDDRATMAIGSLFNFALEPHALPVIREKRYLQMEEMLGGMPGAAVPTAERYAAHLAFCRRVSSALGELTRDLMDVQALVLIAASEEDFWARDEPEDARLERERIRRTQPERYLTACAIYKNEGPFLREWVEFHRLVGVERFFLYDNGSSDDHLEVLAPYLDGGLVVRHEWPRTPGQVEAYDHCIRTHAGEARWIAFIDLDEFLFSPTGRPLPEILTEYEQWPGVGVNPAVFGTSGHRTRPAGLVVEAYRHRGGPHSTLIKSIVDPARVDHCAGAHHFHYRYRLAVDETHYPIHGQRTGARSFERLRFNHYFLKSEEQAGRKFAAPTARGRLRRGRGWQAMEQALNKVPDDLITAYVPALRKALARTEPRTQAPRG